ncbi:MAG: DUF58 domain-containing protein [Planctomycetota bacterium]
MRVLDLISPSDLSRVARLQLLARQVVEGFCSGRHRSPHKGFSVEFKEHRQYVRGDELRNIDWKVFGKSDRLFIREFEEDTNVRVQLVVDRSGSMAYQGERSDVSKFEFAQQVAASLAYLMLGQQDAVGLTLFDDRPREQLPPRNRPSHLKSLLSVLTSGTPRHETSLGQVLQRVASKIHRRGLVVILSDAMDDVDALARPLAQLRASHHEVLFFRVVDPDEVDFPFRGRIQFRDLENAALEQTVDSHSLRQAYIDRFQAHEESLVAMCRKHRLDMIRLVTNQPVAEALHHYLGKRRRMR